jgi:hypothetical protein
MKDEKRCIGLFRWLLTCLFSIEVASARADEGMWPFSSPPVKRLNNLCGVALDPAWFQRLQLGSVRIRCSAWGREKAASGAFIGPNGLILTARHVAQPMIDPMRLREWNKVGFIAKANQEEIKCTGIEVDILRSMDDVTKQVVRGDDSANGKSRELRVAELLSGTAHGENERLELVSLYEGAEYWLYKFERLTDVRVVFFPELIAAGGGEYSAMAGCRYYFDATLFRVYQDGAPFRPTRWFVTHERESLESEVVASCGSPGYSRRLRSFSELQFLQTKELPWTIRLLSEMEETARSFLDGHGTDDRALQCANEFLRDCESHRAQAQKELESLSRLGVLDGVSWKERQAEDYAALHPVAGPVKGARDYLRNGYMAYSMYSDRYFWSNILRNSAQWAEGLILYATERTKPEADRLLGYRGAQLEGKRRYLSIQELYCLEFDQHLLKDSLALSFNELGRLDPFIDAAIGDRDPEVVAAAAYAQTAAADMNGRKQLIEGVGEDIMHASDSLVAFARRVVPILRGLQRQYETDVGERIDEATRIIVRARYEALGRTEAPDADYTPRVSIGSIKSIAGADAVIRWRATFADFLRDSRGKDQSLCLRWRPAAKLLDLGQTHSFIANIDTMTGGSGGPVVAIDGAILGIVTGAHYNEYMYDAIATHAEVLDTHAIITVLRQIYGADRLASEFAR